jgi:hypothetical protein
MGGGGWEVGGGGVKVVVVVGVGWGAYSMYKVFLLNRSCARLTLARTLVQDTHIADKAFFNSKVRAAARQLIQTQDGGMTMGLDTQSLAYELVLGSVHMRNKSMAHYSDIVLDTLARYKIPTRLHTVQVNVEMEDHVALSSAEKRKADATTADAVRGCTTVPSYDEAMVLQGFAELPDEPSTLLKEAEADADIKAQLVHVYKMVMEKYDVAPSKCDKAFFDTFVKTFVYAEAKEVNLLYFALKRLRYVLSKETTAELVEAYLRSIESAEKQEQSTVMLHSRERLPVFHHPAIAVAALLDELDSKWRRKIIERKPLQVKMAHFAPAVKAWLEKLDDAGYNSINAALQLAHKNTAASSTREKLLKCCQDAINGVTDKSNPNKSITNAVSSFIGAAFGLSLSPKALGDSRSGKRKEIYYGLIEELEDKYKAGCMQRKPELEGYMFRDEEYVLEEREDDELEFGVKKGPPFV